MDATTEDFNAWLAQEGSKVGLSPPAQPVNYLRDVYGQGYLPAHVSDSAAPDQTTANVLATMEARYSGPGGYLRSLADKIPEVHADEERPILSRLARTATSIPRLGLDTAANWLSGSPEIGPDTLAPLGMAAMGSLLTPKNAVGVFGGRLAKTADYEALSRAEQLAASGASRDDIWNQTGWFQGKDGKWRFEIDDSGLRFKHGELSKPGDAAKGRLGDLVEHGELFAAYPELANRKTTLSHAFSTGEGETRPRVLGMGGNIAVRGMDESMRATSLLHEIQHQVQGAEGFARGSNPTLEWRPWDVLTEDGRMGLPAHNRYLDVAGEVEARNVARRYSDPDNAERPPYETADRRPDEVRNATPLAAPIPGLIARTPSTWPGIGAAGYLLGGWSRPDQSQSSLPGTIVNSMDRRVDAAARAEGAAEPRRDAAAAAALPEQGIRAYHGSPHDFDSFDVSRIGTGEGAKAYGHGLYFAENEGVARSYKDNLSNTGFVALKDSPHRGGLPVDLMDEIISAPSLEAKRDITRRYLAIVEQRLANLKNRPDKRLDTALAEKSTQKAVDAARALLDADDFSTIDPGRMYEVRIKAKPEEFIDFDKPLNGQTEAVRDMLPMDVWNQIHHPANRKGYSDPEAVKALRAAGIKGIRYLDQQSRAGRVGPSTPANDAARLWMERSGNDRQKAIHGLEKLLRDSGQDLASSDALKALKEWDGPTSNYVVFSDRDVEILKKYGWVPAGMVGGGMMMTAPGDAAAGDRTRGPSPSTPMSPKEYEAWLNEQIKKVK